MKRILDGFVSLLGLTFLLPVLALIGFMILITTGRPVLFSQVRVGLYGREFILKKFRTMKVLKGTEKGSFEPGRRDRVTAVGRFLRASKLDELPQLWNVLKGEMSLVGPRPEIRKWVDAFPEKWQNVLSVLPGITDPASLLYRNEEELLSMSLDPEETYGGIILPHKLRIYEAYVQKRTIIGDLWIIAVTVGKIFRDI